MRIFCFKFYWQSLRRIRLPGLLMAASVTLFDLIYLLELPKFAEDPLFWSARESIYDTVDHFYYMSSMLPFPFVGLLLFFGPILMFLLFRFLTKREEADFYHALPVSRPRLFFALTAAALTYVWGTLVVNGALSMFFDLVVYKQAVIFPELLRLFVWYLVGTLVTVSFAGVAVSATGTTLSAGLVTLLLCVLFRTVAAVFLSTLDFIAPALSLGNGLLAFFDPTFFMPFRLLKLTDLSWRSDMWCVVYNLFLCAAALTLGCVCFTKRESEQATRAAMSGALQAVFRTAAALPFAMLSLSNLLQYFFTSEPGAYMRDTERSSFVLYFLLAVFVYFLYEFVTVKRFRTFPKAALQFTAVLGVCGVAAVACILIRHEVLTLRPAEGEVVKIEEVEDSGRPRNYVTILLIGHMYTIEQPSGFPCYEIDTLPPVTSTDPAVCEFLRKRLNETLSHDENHQNDLYHRTYRLTLKDGRTVTRWISDLDEGKELLRLLSYDEAYHDDCLGLPDFANIRSIYDSDGWLCSAEKALTDAFLEEYAALSDDEKRAMKFGNRSASLRIGFSRGDYFIDSYPIPDSFKKTRALIPKR